MHHELAMRYLAEQRSEQLIAQAERHNGASRPRPVRSFLPGFGRRLVARLADAGRGRPRLRSRACP